MPATRTCACARIPGAYGQTAARSGSTQSGRASRVHVQCGESSFHPRGSTTWLAAVRESDTAHSAHAGAHPIRMLVARHRWCNVPSTWIRASAGDEILIAHLRSSCHRRPVTWRWIVSSPRSRQLRQWPVAVRVGASGLREGQGRGFSHVAATPVGAAHVTYAIHGRAPVGHVDVTFGFEQSKT